MGTTTELRRALKAKFFPYLADRGFVADLRHQPTSTIFRRQGETRVQIVGVQWEKYGKPRFAVDFGTSPVEGLHFQGRLCPPEDMFPTWCPDAGRLQPRRGMNSRSWFRQDATLLQRLMGQPALRPPDDVVDELIALFAELEHYWASGAIGPHMRVWPSSACPR